MKRMLGLILTWAAVSVGVAAGPAASRAEAPADAQGRAVAERLMQAMGGRAAFDAARVLEFRFAVERDGRTLVDRYHAWDRATGRYRLDMKTREGKALRVLFQVGDRKGDAWIEGRRLEALEAAPYLEEAYATFINDTYWLLMPWKWLDPGAHLVSEGSRDVEGHPFDVVRLSFDAGIGLTSNDVYWGYVGPDGLLARWEYVLQDSTGRPGSQPPTAWAWEEWGDAGGGVLVSRAKRRLGGTGVVVIRHPLVRFESEPAETLFAPPR